MPLKATSNGYKFTFKYADISWGQLLSIQCPGNKIGTRIVKRLSIKTCEIKILRGKNIIKKY